MTRKTSLYLLLSALSLVALSGTGSAKNALKPRTADNIESLEISMNRDAVIATPELGSAYSLSGEIGLHEIAKSLNPAPLWLDGQNLTDGAVALINTVSALADEGLDPNAYYYTQLMYIHDADLSSVKESRVNEVFEKAFLKLVSDLGGGTVDPQTHQKRWHRAAVGINRTALLEDVQQGLKTVQNAIDYARPSHPMYQSQSDMLKKLRKLDLREQSFIASGETLQRGDLGSRVDQLREVLVAQGDLASQENAAPSPFVINNPATRYRDIADNTIGKEFDTELEGAVKAFQVRHGLEADGVVAKLTLDALNRPLADRIQQVVVNLERWRWMPSKLEDKHILVNIPEYKLRMTNAGEQIFEMPVVVGKPRHQTPVFSEDMSHVVFAPTWTVPASITNNELIPLEKRKPGYLLKEKIDFFKWVDHRLKPVSRSLITAETYNRKPFPYMLRQRAGKDNVLGKVKFMMPNKHNVYMHDTQAKKLFGKAKRAYSHGCIRLGNPDLMAYVVLQMEGYDQKTVQDYMALTETTRVDLKSHIPTHLVYFSAWQDKQGVMHFREDIYGQDKRLVKALKDQSQANILAANRLDAKSLLASRRITPQGQDN